MPRRRSSLLIATLMLAAAAAVLGAPTVSAATTVGAATTGTQNCSLTPTGGTVTRTIGFRSYNLRVPSGLSSPAPLLLSIHGFWSFPYGQEQATGWSPYADQKKFIVAYPAGNNNSWNVSKGTADVTFLRQVVERISATYCVNPKRVYAEGGSLGSWMSQRLACDAGDLFAAVSGFMGGSPNDFGGCTPSRPIGVSLFHGEDDPLISVGEGHRTRDEWVARNACDPTPVVEPVPAGAAQRYTGCADGVTVTWRSYAGLGHAYPRGADGTDFRDRAWGHLMAHTLPAAGQANGPPLA